MGLLSWLFGEKEEEPPEPLVLGAELRCPSGTEHSYLMLQTDSININKLPEACVTDRKENENIMPFGICKYYGLPCETYMKLEEQWINEEPQRMLLNGKEVITTKSVLLCKDHYEEIEAVTSGQDGVAAARIAEEIELIREMDEKYPGLREILSDPYASLYLKEGMYPMALQFMEDCIKKRGGEIRIEEILTENSLEMKLIIQAIAHLEPSCDAEKPDLFVEVLTARGYENGMDLSTGLDVHVIDAAMMEMLRKDCEGVAKQIEAGGFRRFCEGHTREVEMFSEMAFQFSLAYLYCRDIKARQRVETVEEEAGAKESEATVKESEATPEGKSDIKTDGKSGIKTDGKSGIKTVEVNGKSVTIDNNTFDPNFVDKQGRTNIQRMEQGLAPIGTDGKSVNIHHIDQTNDGPVMEITATEHQQNYSTLHSNTGQSTTQIDRKTFNSWRNEYWKWRSNNLE